MVKFIDSEGLKILWERIKNYIDGKIYKLEYNGTGKNYPIKSDESNNLYVNVPWENTTYTLDSFGITATSEELNYNTGVTSNIQTQLDSKVTSDQNIFIGTTPVAINRQSSDLTLNGVNISGSAGSCIGNAATATAATYVTRERDTNTVSTLTNLPITKALVIANLSYATNLSVTSGMNVGDSITVLCNPSTDFTQAIPNTGAYKSMDGDTLSVKANKPFEINIICYASNSYSISCKVAK